MRARGGTRLRATRKPVVVLAGEDSNDRRSLRILLEDFCPDIRGRIVELNDPVRLRDAGAEKLDERVRTLARKAKARAAREQADLACFFAHEDLDDTDGPKHRKAYERVQNTLLKRFATAHYVLSVAEMEAWLLLFPEALSGVVPSWRVPRQQRNRDTGTITDPKRILMSQVSGRGRRYRESDAPEVFAKAAGLRCLDQPQGTNTSWSRFRSDADDCARLHIPGPRASR